MPENFSPAAAATVNLICFKNWMGNISKVTRSEILVINKDSLSDHYSHYRKKLIKIFYI